jgi:Na+/melibiose symporter-like transporter
MLRKYSHPLSSIFPMLINQHYLASFMAAVANLADPLIVFARVIPYASGRSQIETFIAMYCSIGILGIMALTMIVFMVWKRRLPDLPRAPDTVAAVISYVSEARMLEDLDGCEYANDTELKRRVEGLGKRYTYRNRAGMDGVKRFMVDEE